MSFVRSGDEIATHTFVIAPADYDYCDDRLVNELLGFTLRCAAHTAKHMTDGVIMRSAAALYASPSRLDALLRAAVDAGQMIEVLVGGRRAWQITTADPEGFIHLRLKADIEWERQRKNDNANPALTVPVRLRDGDACRWCGVVVAWRMRRSARGGTYDHLVSRQAATIETMVVACNSCNSSRKDGSRPRKAGDLLPPPDDPYYSTFTITWLEGNAYRRDHGLPVPAAAAQQVVAGRMRDGSQPPCEPLPEHDGSQPPRIDSTSTAVSAPAHSGVLHVDQATVSAPGETGVLRAEESPGSPPAPDGSQPPDTTPEPTAVSAPAHSGVLHVDDGAPGAASATARPRRSQQVPVEAEGPAVDGTGRVGTGRDGTGLVGSPSTPDGDSNRRRRRGGRRRRTPAIESEP